MYAGAAREAVFSVPAVIRRINADFIPLALRATLVNGVAAVRDDDEKWLYQRLNRAKLAPQGIGVLSPAGEVLVWAQMFDDNRSVLDFLDHSLKRLRETAGARQPLATQRYLKFPSEKVGDFQDETKLPAVIAQGHAKGKTCPARHVKGRFPPGSIIARLVGRALDEQGRPLADIVKQENYVEDQFGVSPEMLKTLVKALAEARTKPVRLPDDFSKLCATHAHLGHIDVQPCLCMIKDRAENKGEWKRCQFWARRVETGKKSLWQVEGQSEVVSAVAINGKGVHNVRLAWEGFIELDGKRLLRLVLSARGREELQFAKDDHPLTKVNRDEVAFLPAGRPLDVACGVRYGILSEAEPVGAEQTGDTGAPEQEIPDEARKQLVQALGGSFIVYRDKVQEELKLSDEQKRKLHEEFPGHVQETMKVFEKIKDLKPQERDKTMHEHRRKSDQKLSALLRDVLDAEQQERLLQLQLQQAGAFALMGRNEAFLKLKITDEQREKFMEVVRDMQKKIESLVKEAQSGGNPSDLGPKVMKIRRAHERRIEAVLNDTQRKQWQKLLGKPFDLGD